MGRRTALLLVLGSVCIPIATAHAAATFEPVATGLSFPSNMAFAPDGSLFFAEKDTGDIRVIRDGELVVAPVAHIDVLSSSEQGLLGLALDPAFDTQPWIYVYYSDPVSHLNRLARIRADDVEAGPEPLLDALTTEHGYHNGGDLVFGGDGKLYVAVGEVHDGERAQDPDDLGGKVLRLNPDGSTPSDNPLGAGNPAYSMGHRNSFGLCVDPSTGVLWETENGPGSDDEVNRVEPGGNYGWPDQLGPGGEPTFIDPVLDFPAVIVPTGCAVWQDDLYFGAYGTGLLYRLSLPAADGAHADAIGDLGAGITDLQVGPDGDLYIATSDAIVKLAGTGSPAPTMSPPAAPPPADAAGGGWKSVIAVVAGAALAAGLIARFVAGWRLRRETRGR